MTFRLLVGAPNAEDGTSIYRAWGPITALRKSIPDLEVHSFHTIASHPSGTRFAWPEALSVDAIMLQRPFAQEHVAMSMMAKKFKKPLWVDYDDNLLAVPECNPTHANYSRPEVRSAIEQICKMADIVTVSTKALGEALSKFSSKILVVPNALDMNLLHRMDDALPRNKCVVWRGSHCHFTDLQDHTDAILAAYKEFPEWSFVFMGYNPTWITSKMDKEKRVRIVPFDEDYLNFVGNMQRLRSAIQIVPLSNLDFNYAKSRIAHLEGSLAGSAMLVPDWEEWQDGTSYRYKSQEDFKEKLFHMMAMPLEDLARTNNKDWDWVKTNRSLTAVNEFRRGIIEAFKRGSV